MGRLGAVLYGAYYFSEASKIVGIEINKDFCKLQEDTLAKFKLKDRVKIVLGNMCAQTELLKSADVIVLNNVFSWFMPEQLQAKMWQCLHRVIRPGCLLVTIPALEDSLTPLKTGIKIESWVKQMDGYEPTARMMSRWNSQRSSSTKFCPKAASKGETIFAFGREPIRENTFIFFRIRIMAGVRSED